MTPPLMEDGLLTGMVNTLNMVQVICFTIDGVKYVCLGPVLHVPPAGIYVGNIEEIAFGELIPAELAAKLFNGGFSDSMGVQ